MTPSRPRRCPPAIAALVCLYAASAATVLAQAPAAPPAPAAAAAPAPAAPARADEPLPGMRFNSTIASGVLYDALKATPKFSQLDNELHGSPMTVSVTHIAETSTASMAGSITSAIFAGATLGLLPVVTNRDFTVKYEIYVNGNAITSHSYSHHISRVYNALAKDKTYGLGEDGLAWVKSTAAQFAADAATDPRVDALIDEYHVYFDPPPATATPSSP